MPISDPASFGPDDRVAVIAGSDRLPIDVAEIPVRVAKSDWLQLRIPRAPRICAVVMLIGLLFFQVIVGSL